ncbi:Probable phospholipid-binding lipoprotein mlaA precursor [Lautropia mirabilis]|uniref:VacJ-like protein n=2 Tax=Lautropia mirabilis TaxID=47671 RepID=E7S0X0_9BURK|nr:VacJ family lipoprotein [Lautropia mirabilis]EFV93626.1 VacJ-like protein [Lautropia mirabilis ATCC 51599]VEG99211.1 Probable phospholipid-binding lipoprotein mlaA precursor [Lautropia mirabilis]
MTGETRPDGMMAPVHLRLAGVALALSQAGCASVSGTNGGDAAGTGAAAGKDAASSAASASAATSAATDAATSAAGDALKAAGVPTDLSVDNVTGGVKLSHLTTYDPKDPLQAYNRVMFAFNERADQYALKPVAKAYRFITPKPVQFVVGNFFSNLGDLWTGFNNLLQGKGKAAASDTARFFVNSTLGFLGFADVATEMGLEKHNEDFGQTLGWWGVPSGPYFVIPLLGPSTIRDAASRPVDTYGQPYMWQDGHDALKWSLWTVDKVHTRASLLDAEGALNDAALDKYTLMRDGWLARRRNQVYDGDPPDEDDAADPYGDDPYADDPYADDPTQDESDSGAADDASAQSAADKASDAASDVSDKASDVVDKVKEVTKKKAGKAAGSGS